MDAQPASRPSTRSTIQVLEARIRRYNSDIDPSSTTFHTAVLLLAATEYGQNIDILSRRTGYDRSFVARCARRLIDNGVWDAGRTVGDWSPEDEASGAFWNDVAVGEGKLCRRLNADGQIEWAPAGYWKKSYEFIEPAGERPVSTTYRDPAAARSQGEAPAAGALDESVVASEAPEGEDSAARPAAVQPVATGPAVEPPESVGAGGEDAGADAPATAASEEVPSPDASAPDDPDDSPPSELFPGAVWLR